MGRLEAMGWTQSDLDRIKGYLADGFSCSEIARFFKTSRNAVIGVVARNNLRGERGVVRKVGAERPIGPKIKSRPLPEPAPVSQPPIGPALVSVGRGRCQFIYGDVAGNDWRMCGHPGFPWCDYHRSICVVKRNPKDAAA